MVSAQTLPMSGVRNLAHSPDRDLRRRAFAAEIAAWEQAALPLAASMNGIKGEVLTVSARRGWDSPLAAMLHANRIDQETLDAMLGAAEEFFPDFRRYLKAKARALGLSQLAWYDLFAPVGGDTDPAAGRSRTVRTFIVQHFGSYSDRLRAFARAGVCRALDRCRAAAGQVRRRLLHVAAGRRIAHPGQLRAVVRRCQHPRPRARPRLPQPLLSRADSCLQRGTPMTMAETASIFCETIVKDAALVGASEDEQFTILEASLQDACQVVVDISSRFRFERAVFEQRDERELSIDELKALMLDAQAETYGDGLDASTYHPYMWAVKGHYYSASELLLQLPVHVRPALRARPLRALTRTTLTGSGPRYDDLLAHTGRADAATLAARFGIDLRQPAFWRASLELIRADIDRFEALVDARVAG